MRQESDVEQAIEQYADMIKHICFVYMKNESDTEDVFQDVFLKYALFSEPFQSDEHKKAWLIRVTVNRCKDMLRSFFRTHTCSLEEAMNMAEDKDPDLSHVLESVMKLPHKYRIIIYLHYYEGYSAVEIAGILNKKVNTVYTHLSRAKAELKKMLGGDFDETDDT
ncbi:MAG: RNA polymerase sigma factor [Clostridiaceae bacterium]|nr:RNA polymerase sigma factor [Clostridiaceae bacterium]